MTATLARLATAEGALSDDDADVLFQGASIGTLENCLGGVQSSYQQIAADNNTLAAEDISASSAACLSLVGGTSGGLVYPFDFPDPDVLLVGRYLLCLWDQLGGGKHPDHRVHQLDQLDGCRKCTAQSPQLGRPRCDLGTRRRTDRR